ncbi:MAG: aminotransferase class I/II-fold pyridoxal phosphate-dependent enzyme [Chitinophagales bacterium]
MIISTANRLNTVEEYYFSKKLRQIQEMKAEGKDIINIGIGSPDLPPSKQTVDALKKTANRQDIHGYQSYTGIPELRVAMAKWYKRVYDVDVDSGSEILPLMGSKEGIMHISMAFLNSGDGVLVPNPGYLTYSSVSKLLDANLLPYNLMEENNWKPDWATLEDMDLEKVKIMWVNYPNMPTGADASYKLFERLVSFAHKHNVLIVNDNPYSLVLNKDPKSILEVDGAKEVAIELNSLSKSHNMAGWRVGMVLGASEYLQPILKVKSNMDSGMFLGIQQAAIEALTNSEDWHELQNKEYGLRRKMAYEILDMLDCRYTSNQVGMFVWAKVPEGVLSVEVWIDELLQKTNVFMTPGFIFGSAGERYVRISLCSSLKVLEEAKNRLQKFHHQTPMNN